MKTDLPGWDEINSERKTEALMSRLRNIEIWLMNRETRYRLKQCTNANTANSESAQK